MPAHEVDRTLRELVGEIALLEFFRRAVDLQLVAEITPDLVRTDKARELLKAAPPRMTLRTEAKVPFADQAGRIAARREEVCERDLVGTQTRERWLCFHVERHDPRAMRITAGQ